MKLARKLSLSRIFKKEMKLFCTLPFSRISIDDDGNIWPACCPDWVDFPLGNVFKQSWEEIWYGEAATKFRASMYDGSLKYCDRNWCNNISDAEKGIKNLHVMPHEERPLEWDRQPPIHVNMNYDETCNLSCPSCRVDVIHLKGKALNKVKFIQEYVANQILPTAQSIALTGVGDPFMSKVFRNFLFNFDSKKYPRLKYIHFHTNGQLFDERTYNKMPGIHHLRLSADISIDASTPDVYSRIRRLGNWEKLMENLSFIKNLDSMGFLGISMVVQQDNYKQMLPFIELGETLVKGDRETVVEFKRPRQWGHLSNKEFKKISMDHADTKEEFLEILRAIEAKRAYNAANNILPSIQHNFQEYIR